MVVGGQDRGAAEEIGIGIGTGRDGMGAVEAMGTSKGFCDETLNSSSLAVNEHRQMMADGGIEISTGEKSVRLPMIRQDYKILMAGCFGV